MTCNLILTIPHTHTPTHIHTHTHLGFTAATSCPCRRRLPEADFSSVDGAEQSYRKTEAHRLHTPGSRLPRRWRRKDPWRQRRDQGHWAIQLSQPIVDPDVCTLLSIALLVTYMCETWLWPVKQWPVSQKPGTRRPKKTKFEGQRWGQWPEEYEMVDLSMYGLPALQVLPGRDCHDPDLSLTASLPCSSLMHFTS